MSGADKAGAFHWSPEAVEYLRKSRGEGHSCAQIAKELARQTRAPVTRAAVIGKVYRLGLETPVDRRKVTARRCPPAKKPKVVAAKERASKNAIAKRRVVDLMRVEAKKAPAAPPASDPDAIAAAPCCLLELRFASCRWPLNRTAPGGDTLFCNNDKVEGRSFCDGHAKRAYVRTQSNDQKRAAQIERENNRTQAREAGRQSYVFGYGMAKRFA